MEMNVKATISHDNIQIVHAISIMRNISEYPFPVGLTEETGRQVQEELIHALNECGMIRDKGLARQEAGLKSLLDPAFDTGDQRIAPSHLIDATGALRVVLNHGEHLRMSLRSEGQELWRTWEELDKWDSLLEQSLVFAFDEKWGYLTSDIRHVGTGLNIQALLCLPCLHELSYVERIHEASYQLGFSVERINFPSISASLPYYRIVNRHTLGLSEKHMLERIENIVSQIVKKEMDARETLLISKRIDIEDKIMRAFGIASHARRIGFEEGLCIVADLKVGGQLGLMDSEADRALNRFVEEEFGIRHRADHLGTQQSDIARANRLRAIVGVK